MGKILFEINYNIYPDKREEYLNSIKELKSQINSKLNKEYFIFEDEKKMNNFSEIIICNSEEELEQFEDEQDDEIKDLISKLFSDYIIGNKVTYLTKKEV